MIRSSVLIAALAVASSLALPHKNANEDRVSELVSTAFEYMVATYKKIDPERDLHFYSSKYERAFGGLIKADFDLKNGVFSGFSELSVKYLKTNPEQLSAQFQVTAPRVSLEGDYIIDGKAFGQKVKGEGKLQITVSDMTNTMSNLQLSETAEKKALRIKSFGLSADIAEVQVTVTGLKAEGMTVEAFEKLASEAIRKEFVKELAELCETFEQMGIDQMHDQIGDRTLEEEVQYLKEHMPAAVVPHLFSRVFASLV